MTKYSVGLVLGVVLFISSKNSQAASYYYTPENKCSSIDFRETFPLKMRNQNKVSWCFAHAASDYLQYAYHLDEQVSAADIAINYSQSNVGKIIGFFKRALSGSNIPAQTGFIKIAVKKIIPQGYCPESALPSDEWTKVSAHGEESKVEIKQSILDTLALQKQVKSGSITQASELSSYFKFKNINRDQFFEILQSSSSKNVMLNLRNAACKNERKPFGSEVMGTDFQLRGKHIFTNMNATFNKQMPVTIDFFSDVFRHSDNPKRDVNELHTVLVYGRKFNTETQECQYMIKDSYGEQCTKYDPKLSCEGGYVWLPENKLFRAMTSQLVLYKK